MHVLWSVSRSIRLVSITAIGVSCVAGTGSVGGTRKPRMRCTRYPRGVIMRIVVPMRGTIQALPSWRDVNVSSVSHVNDAVRPHRHETEHKDAYTRNSACRLGVESAICPYAVRCTRVSPG